MNRLGFLNDLTLDKLLALVFVRGFIESEKPNEIALKFVASGILDKVC